MRLIPGDPAQVLLGFENTDPEQLAAVRRDLGLDRPIAVQFVRWLGRLVRGDLGTSARTGRPIVALLAEALPFTLELAVYGLGLAVLIPIPMGPLPGRPSPPASPTPRCSPSPCSASRCRRSGWGRCSFCSSASICAGFRSSLSPRSGGHPRLTSGDSSFPRSRR